ncbi:unnamed protein product [[Candida] boidinii]|nr:unnamed protein product [[Candida] boidinii]GMF66430.1 unnamed protein product [[Candida] boidinii]
MAVVGHKGDHGNHGGHPVTTKTPVAPGTSFHWSNSSAAEVPTTFESTTIISTSEVIPTTSSFIPSTSEIPSTTSASPSPSSSAIDYRIPLYGQCYKEGSYYPYSCIDGAHCRVDSYWYGQCVFDGQLYNQCGGIAFRGKKSCDTGLTCSYLNDYYHQCLIPTTYAYTYI